MTPSQGQREIKITVEPEDSKQHNVYRQKVGVSVNLAELSTAGKGLESDEHSLETLGGAVHSITGGGLAIQT